jgi:hypothetical protein
VRQVPQLLNGSGDLGDRCVQGRLRGFWATLAQLVLGVSQGQTDGHQALLGSVVEITLDPATLLVPGFDDARP